MKEAVSSFDLIAIVAELQELVGGHLDKIYQDGEDFHFKVNIPGGGHREVFVRPGKWLCLREKAEAPETLPPFASALRRYLSNASITAIAQRGFDRVVIFSLQTERACDLVVELFGGGNIVLVEDGETILCQRTQVLWNRQIKTGQKYDFPPGGMNPRRRQGRLPREGESGEGRDGEDARIRTQPWRAVRRRTLSRGGRRQEDESVVPFRGTA